MAYLIFNERVSFKSIFSTSKPHENLKVASHLFWFKERSPSLPLLLIFLHFPCILLFLCIIRWCLGIWDMEEGVDSFSWKELHAKINVGHPIFMALKLEESISTWTLNSFHILHAFINSSWHQMFLEIMGVEEEGESFFWKEFEHQIILGCHIFALDKIES